MPTCPAAAVTVGRLPGVAAAAAAAGRPFVTGLIDSCPRRPAPPPPTAAANQKPRWPTGRRHVGRRTCWLCCSRTAAGRLWGQTGRRQGCYTAAAWRETGPATLLHPGSLYRTVSASPTGNLPVRTYIARCKAAKMPK